MCGEEEQVPKSPPPGPQKRRRDGGDTQRRPDCVYLGGNKNGASALGKAVIPRGAAPKPHRGCPSLPALPGLAFVFVCFRGGGRRELGKGGGTKAGRSREGGEPI